MRVDVKARTLDFLARYGERGYAVLRAAVDAALSAGRSGGVRLGDFSYKEVVSRLRASGLKYNPSMLLRILERDYGVIETTYHSSGQHWWRFLDLDAVVEALEEYESGEAEANAEDEVENVEPEVVVTRAQVAALGLDVFIPKLRSLAAKATRGRLTATDRALLERVAYRVLPRAAELLPRCEELGLEREARLLRELLALADKVSRRLLASIPTTSEPRSAAVEEEEAEAKAVWG